MNIYNLYVMIIIECLYLKFKKNEIKVLKIKIIVEVYQYISKYICIFLYVS